TLGRGLPLMRRLLSETGRGRGGLPDRLIQSAVEPNLSLKGDRPHFRRWIGMDVLGCERYGEGDGQRRGAADGTGHGEPGHRFLHRTLTAPPRLHQHDRNVSGTDWRLIARTSGPFQGGKSSPHFVGAWFSEPRPREIRLILAHRLVGSIRE